MDSLVGIIIPVYQRAHLLNRALTSVVNQTYSNFKVVVVDDGSTDNPKEVVDNFSDKRIDFVRHYHNRGLNSARNTGLTCLKDVDCISFLDSDDEWLENKLERQLSFVKDKKKPYFVFSNIYEYAINGYKKGLQWGKREFKDYKYQKCLVTAPSSWLLSRDVFDKVKNFDESFYRFDDIEFVYRLCMEKIPAYYFSEVLVNKYETLNNNSQISLRSIFAREQFYQKHRLTLTQNRDFLENLFKSMGKDARNMKNKALAKKYFLKAYKLSPWKLRYLVRAFI